MRIFTWAAAAAVATTGAAQAQQPAPTTRIERLDPALDRVIAPGTRIERVATGFGFAEGPMWRDGKLWFADVTGDTLRTVAPDGRVSVILKNAGGLPNPPAGTNTGNNAMVTDRDGSVLMMQMGARRIVRVDARGSVRPFLAAYQGKRLNSPNDLVFARDGALWFTDPPFGLFNGMDKDPAKQLRFNGVYRYAGGKLTAVITDLAMPNGIGFSPDGHTLYVSNSGPERFVRAYAVGANGRLSHPHDLIRYGTGKDADVPDGLKVDTAGNIWTSGPGGIRIISPAGKVLGQIKLPEVAANLAFADDGRTVYITASTSIYRLRTNVPGELPLYYRR